MAKSTMYDKRGGGGGGQREQKVQSEEEERPNVLGLVHQPSNTLHYMHQLLD